MPIFQSHDIYHNVTGIMRSNDQQTAQDFVTSEIAYLIAYRKKDLINQMKRAGYSVPNNVSDATLINLIAQYAGRDIKMNDALAGMIADRHRREEISSADGDTTTAPVKTTPAAGASTQTSTSQGGSSSGGGWGIVSTIGNLIGGIFDYSGDKKTAQAQIETQKMALAQQVLAMRSQPQTDSNTKYVLIFAGIAALGLISLIAYSVLKKKKNNG